MSRVELNGEPREIEPGTTIADLVRSLTANPTGCAVAVNGAVVPRSGWERGVRSGDQVEVLTAVQGG